MLDAGPTGRAIIHPMAKQDYYDILGVSRQAGQDEIKRAYRKLAKQYHPDRNKGDASATSRFKEVQEAYDVLGDKEKRRQYDRFGTVGVGAEAPGGGGWQAGPGGWQSAPGGWQVHQSGGPGTIEFDLGDLEELFGGMGGAPGGGAGGGIGSIFERFMRQGGGRARARGPRGPRPQRGPTSSRGQDVEHEVQLTFDQAVHGATLEVDLSRGGGARETIKVKIPPGVQPGQRIRVRGKGQSGVGAGAAGDMYIVCSIQPHPYFTRIGNDIYLDVPITVTEACLGTKLELPTIDGRTVVTIPPGTASGRKLRLKGKGVMDARTQERGDHYAVVRIVPPNDLTPRQEALLTELESETQFNPRAELPWSDETS